MQSPQFPSGPVRRPMSIVVKLIVLTVLVYLAQIFTLEQSGQSVVSRALAMERDLVLESGQVWRLLTSAFCHNEASFTHIAFNMLALFFVGRIVSHVLGDREFLWMYLAAAVCSGIVQVGSLAIFRQPGEHWVLGASGAVYAVFMIFCMHYPKMKLLLLGLIPVQARWLLAAMMVYDVAGYMGWAPSLFSTGSVGHASHLGGLAFGFLYFKGEMRITRLWDQMATPRKRPQPKAQPSLRVYDPDVQPELNLDTHVDTILAKISREGEASLTARERRILKQASENLQSQR